MSMFRKLSLFDLFRMTAIGVNSIAVLHAAQLVTLAGPQRARVGRK